MKKYTILSSMADMHGFFFPYLNADWMAVNLCPMEAMRYMVYQEEENDLVAFSSMLSCIVEEIDDNVV